MRFVTGKPIKLIGVGEKMDALDEFSPARIANRILGMGDIVALVEKAAAAIDAEQARKAAERIATLGWPMWVVGIIVPASAVLSIGGLLLSIRTHKAVLAATEDNF